MCVRGVLVTVSGVRGSTLGRWVDPAGKSRFDSGLTVIAWRMYRLSERNGHPLGFCKTVFARQPIRFASLVGFSHIHP